MTIAFNNQYVLFDSHDFQFFGVYTDGLYKYQECQKERRDGSHHCLVGFSNVHMVVGGCQRWIAVHPGRWRGLCRKSMNASCQRARVRQRIVVGNMMRIGSKNK
jgi:hypothetical protein